MKWNDMIHIDVGYQGKTVIPKMWGYGMCENRGFFTFNGTVHHFDDGLQPIGWRINKENHLIVMCEEIDSYEQVRPMFSCIT